MKTTKTLTIVILTLAAIAGQGRIGEAAVPMGTAFIYEGLLTYDSQPLDGLYDLQFKLFDDPDVTLGIQVGSTIDMGELEIIDGNIEVELDFGGSVFNGDARWLEIGFRPGELDDPDVYTVIVPRAELKPIPYALHTRGVFMDNDYPYNLFVGIGAGNSNTTGHTNTYIGYRTGFSGSGLSNTFVGCWAGFSNTGDSNTFIGKSAGRDHTTGWSNTFLGSGAGRFNIEGGYNTFVGDAAGYNSISGNENTFLGCGAGFYNNAGEYNTFVGDNAGLNNKGDRNTCVGMWTGCENSTGSGNVFIGYKAGYNETGSNKLYIANNNGTPLIYGDFSSSRVGIGTTDPRGNLDVNGSIYQRGNRLHADYVFEPDYDLESIDKHSELMWRNKHLPAIPKAMLDGNGQEIVEVGAHRKGIVEELEKAHIYIDQLHKRITILEEKLAKLEAQLNTK